MPAFGFGAQAYEAAEGYGLPMKQAIRDGYGTVSISLTGRGEMMPNENSYCEIDPDGGRTSGAFRCCASTGSGATTS